MNPVYYGANGLLRALDKRTCFKHQVVDGHPEGDRRRFNALIESSAAPFS